MIKNRIISKNFIYLIIGRAAPSLISLINQLMFIKYTNPKIFADYWLIVAIWSGFQGIFAGGVDVNFQSKNNIELYRIYYKYKLIIGLISLLVVPIILWLYIGIYYEVIIMVIGLISMTLVEFILTGFRVLNLDKYSIYPKSLQLIILGGLLYFLKPDNLINYGLIFTSSWILVLILYSILMRKYTDEKNFTKKRLSIDDIKSILWLGGSVMFSQIILNSDFIVLQNIYGSNFAGDYKLLFMISFAYMPLLTVVNTMYLSNIVTTPSGYIKYTRQSIFVGMLFSICYLFFSIIFVDLLYKNYFHKIIIEGGYTIILILICAAFFNSVSTILSYKLIAENDNPYIFFATGAAAACSVIFAVIMVKEFGIIGAGLSQLMTSLFLTAIFLLKYKNISSYAIK